MALTKAQVREILAVSGVDSEHMADAVNKIIDCHADSISALREEVAELKEKVVTYKADADKLPGVQKELEELKVTADKAGDYIKLKAEYDQYKAGIEAEKVNAQKKSAYTDVLKDAGITSDKAIAKVLKYTNLDDIELDDKGKVVNAKDHMKAAKEEWAELVSQTQTSGVKTENPPANTGGGSKTMAEIMEIKDTSERQKALREHLISMEE